jgi:hypothetical protein
MSSAISRVWPYREVLDETLLADSQHFCFTSLHASTFLMMAFLLRSQPKSKADTGSSETDD